VINARLPQKHHQILKPITLENIRGVMAILNANNAQTNLKQNSNLININRMTAMKWEGNAQNARLFSPQKAP
jgi:hypothetical protein